MFDAPFDAAIGSNAEPDTHYAPDAPDTRNGPPPPHADDRPLPLSELEARITELAGHLNAATHRWLLLVAEFDRREGWADGTTHSCAHWLGWKCGLALGAAREKVRVARALEALPEIGAAMARGELSYSKVRALTRVASPETEDTLLTIARHGTAHHVEAVVRGYRRALDAAELSREASQHARRGLHWHHDDDGSLVVQARLTAEGGALLLKVLQRAMRDDGALTDAGTLHVPAGTSAPTGGVPAGTSGRPSAASAGASRVPAGTSSPEPDTPAQRRADALLRVAEGWLVGGDAALAGGERAQLVVHVDAQVLAASVAGRCELDEGPALSAETVRRLGCDASLVAIVEDGEGRILDVGRRTRSIPSAIGRALRARDRGCRYPGCTHRRHVDGHHVEHWAHGGATRLSNLVLLCRRHHRAVHEGGVTVAWLDDGALRFTDATGRRIEAAPATRGEPHALEAIHLRDGLRIDPRTATGRWDGQRLDLDWTVAGLCAERERARVSRTSPRPRRTA